MSYWGYRNELLVLPEHLIDFAWSAPMRELAPKVGLSDVGLKKLLGGLGIYPPPQGYWNKVRAGKLVPSKPKSGPRGPGQTGRIMLDARFASVLVATEPMPSSGPFASALVPEDLEELRALELKAIGRAASARKLDPVHPGLRRLLATEDRRREKVAGSAWHWDEPKFESAVNKRRIRLLNALFLTLQKRGYSGDVHERDGDLHAGAVIGDTWVGLDLEIFGRHRTVTIRGYARPDPALPGSTPLILKVPHRSDGDGSESWQDDDAGKLEDKIASIAAGVIVAGEARFRRRLREEEEWLARMRREAEERRQKELEALNRKRVEQLHASGALLRQANDVRALVAALRQAAEASQTDLDEHLLRGWEEWALAEADKVDPIKSGQFRSHFVEPKLET